MRAPFVRLRLRLNAPRKLDLNGSDGRGSDASSALEDRLNVADMLDRLRISGQAGDDFRVAAAQAGAGEGLNRYHDVLPFDHSIPHAPPVIPPSQSAYINASRIPAFESSSSQLMQDYVAAQAPLPHGFPCFFHHLVADRVPLLVNLTRCEESGAPKADRYWPEQVGSSATAEDWRVTLLSSDDPVCDGWELTRRRLRLSWNGTSQYHDLTQIHVTSWPDFGSAGTDTYERLLSFIQKENRELALRNKPSTTRPPPLWIHCSAGVGRTGTVIAGLMVLDYLEHLPSSIRIPKAEDRQKSAQDLTVSIITHMRSHRAGMVQGVGQARMVVSLIEHRWNRMDAQAAAPPSTHNRAGMSYPPSSRHPSLNPSSTPSRRPSLLSRRSSSRRSSVKGPGSSPRRWSMPSSEGEQSNPIAGLTRSLSRTLSRRRNKAQ